MMRCADCRANSGAELDHGPCDACWDVELLYSAGDYEGAALAAGEDWDF